MWRSRHTQPQGAGRREPAATDHGKRLRAPLHVSVACLSLPPPRQGDGLRYAQGEPQAGQPAQAPSPLEILFGNTGTGCRADGRTYEFLRLEFDLTNNPYVIFVPYSRDGPKAYVASAGKLREKPLSSDPSTPEGLQELVGIAGAMNIPLIAGRGYDLENRLRDAGHTPVALGRMKYERKE